ncbi:cation efflux family protein [Colletotrichum gloeosporioides Cg-14]|uniref:Cation efflux family protein n=1 Tax=Colletotrichum gloeosporioides (strain Cg-14) TaxID=1237896 RepID=T0KYI7_COLGC|nr:cation efflux family protein [Colletotrichum gloeosporioides Cg-14]
MQALGGQQRTAGFHLSSILNRVNPYGQPGSSHFPEVLKTLQEQLLRSSSCNPHATAAMEPDLSKSITMHPYPFHFNTPSHLANTSRNSSRSGSSNISSEEQPRVPGGGIEPDPFGLSCAFKTPEELAQIKADISQRREPRHTKIGPWRRSRQVQKYYKTQNAAIGRMLKSVDDHVADARQEAGDSHLRFKIAVWGSFGTSIVLAALQLHAAIKTESLSLITTTADAIFDPLSYLVLTLSARTTQKVNPRRFPAGESRLETVGNIIFCNLMTSLSMVIIAFAARELSDTTPDRHVTNVKSEAVISVCVAFGTKLVLFIYCFPLRNRYSQVRILWSDHRNALLVNGFGILTAVGGPLLKWWIDPAGAVILSVIVIILWSRTAIAEFLLLVGVTASVETQQLIMYVCLTHSESIQGIKTVCVYHSGPRLIAEVDIVMDRKNTLADVHGVAEALQVKLESLPDVERAYVHIDYEMTHKQDRGLKKDL